MRTAGLVLFLFIPIVSYAAEVKTAPVLPANHSFISIIIDDLGHRQKEGVRAVALPGALTYGILPHTPYAKSLAKRAYKSQKEVILHVCFSEIYSYP